MVHEIVIVGGGLGGVRVAKILAKWGGGGPASPAGRHHINITLIDKSRYHTFYPNLYEVATAHIPEVFGHMPLDFFNLKSSVIYPLEDIFLDDLNVSVLEDEVIGVDFKTNKIRLKKFPAHNYNFLVLAAGSETNYFNIAGMSPNAFPLKGFFDALEVRNAVDEVFFRAPKNHIVKIAIGGGGFTGCELAGELIGYMKKLALVHGRPEYYGECLIIEATENLLGGASPALRKKAKARLEKLGIKFKFKSSIHGVEGHEIVLEDGSKIPYDVLVWTAGVKANDLTKLLFGVKLEKNACVAVDKNLRVLPYENVFGVGDITYCVDEATGKSLPMTASVAIREAKYTAENIKRMILKKPLINYKPHHAGFIIPLGGKYALLESHGLRIAGIIPWLVKQTTSLHYWATLVGWMKAFRLWKKGLEVYLMND
ncbi:MAG: FAD-dependent pyridine nucleotide-disulfide oxidoreductase [Candidatus Giovannonibacteria bacterium GW2011_GWC2_44_9]|uniref:FAD-dependent pyridine nucleotide-disulfide oxidoreductase n=3 Tax=Candidatus Giovannoniibacteriota TaxID=1752738 RepID=A0A0G1IXI1_9BACT|nr:MAG: FAD-dependent pyridine nucleotide-disulfide oxidoreductase [Candidatus Giovannonibacteria bacterium GW2011_GWB1_44_23]KKT63688.1 MAG: FAD-dependent pyridine nucleotide-disulfide oxidoreductase [Candidatus Giovannonibacteria bacterium GW2011_GWA1_44_29]KKT84359.1 MAG: FAD-dependent pyridine nucleotide-disulfide oxidoreductase [Candidatus Giovannonibacteria bacterium GW2011_GWC2_44_9]